MDGSQCREERGATASSRSSAEVAGPTRRGPFIVLLGRPGSGKSTQAERLASLLGVTHVSTGELLRRCLLDPAVATSELAEEIALGEPVPDATITSLLRHTVDPEVGAVLDGFPRSAHQCVLIDELWGPDTVQLAVVLDVSVSEALSRLGARSTCQWCRQTPPHLRRDCVSCGYRPDHWQPEAFEIAGRKIWTHDRSVGEVERWFERRSRLAKIPAEESPDLVFHRLVETVVAAGLSATFNLAATGSAPHLQEPHLQDADRR